MLKLQRNGCNVERIKKIAEDNLNEIALKVGHGIYNEMRMPSK
jgi:hypothetical protein